MKLSARKFKSKMLELEELMEVNFDAKGATMAQKAASVAKEWPKGIVDKMTFLTGLFEKLERGETPSADELKQAGYCINAVYPYLSNGASPRKNPLVRIVAIIVIALAAFLAWKFLH